ncbi:MAG: efflux RND transporter permease subunit, partial [Flavobacterium sp.]|nr:efflux RND transporter permease subunit [Candidatus Neoflavobacterium equi]
QETLMKADSIIGAMPVVEGRMMVAGRSLINGVSGGSYGMGVFKLQDFEKRTDPSQSVDAVVGQLFGMASQFKDAQVLFFTPPSVQGFGSADGFEFNLQSKADDNWQDMYKVVGEMAMALNQRPEIQYAMTNFNPNFPQYQMDINVERAKDAGVSVSSIINTMQGYFGGLYTTDFNRFGKQYRVMIQAEPSDRDKMASIDKVTVKNQAGNMVAINQFIDFKPIYGPESVSRFNLLKSAKFSGKANPGYSSGDAIKAIEEVAAQHLPKSYSYEYSGMTREEIAAGSQQAVIFLLSLVFVYFLLSAQYESYVLPFAVLLSLPVGIAGAILFVKLTGLENNIYFQVALIMLIGLLAKNAILIVEYALQRRHHGLSLFEAAIDGARARLRPILMTSFAFILGLVPLAFASGVGAVGNRSIGMGAVGGMLIGTVFGVFVIPVLFVIFQALQEKISGKKPVTETQDQA